MTLKYRVRVGRKVFVAHRVDHMVDIRAGRTTNWTLVSNPEDGTLFDSEQDAELVMELWGFRRLYRIPPPGAIVEPVPI